MRTYRVRWEIDIEADNPEAAAREALAIQRDPRSIATHFVVSYSDGPMAGSTPVDVYWLDHHRPRRRRRPAAFTSIPCHGNR